MDKGFKFMTAGEYMSIKEGKSYEKAIVKFNGGRGALLCNGCNVILSYGSDHEDMRHYCEKCFDSKNSYSITDVDYWEKDATLVIGEKEYFFRFEGDEPTLRDAIEEYFSNK